MGRKFNLGFSPQTYDLYSAIRGNRFSRNIEGLSEYEKMTLLGESNFNFSRVGMQSLKNNAQRQLEYYGSTPTTYEYVANYGDSIYKAYSEDDTMMAQPVYTGLQYSSPITKQFMNIPEPPIARPRKSVVESGGPNYHTITGLIYNTRYLASNSIKAWEYTESTDTVAQEKLMTNLKYTVGGNILGSFFGRAGVIANMLLSSVYSVIDTKIANSIQRKGDAKRTVYNFQNNDLGKFGTYVYNNTTNEWVARDAKRVNSRVLGGKASV